MAIELEVYAGTRYHKSNRSMIVLAVVSLVQADAPTFMRFIASYFHVLRVL